MQKISRKQKRKKYQSKYITMENTKDKPKPLIERFDPKVLEDVKATMIRNVENKALDAFMRASYASNALPEIENLIAALQVQIAEVDGELEALEKGDLPNSKPKYEIKKGLKFKREALVAAVKEHEQQAGEMGQAAQKARSEANEALSRADFIRSHFPEKVLAEASAHEEIKEKQREEEKESAERMKNDLGPKEEKAPAAVE